MVIKVDSSKTEGRDHWDTQAGILVVHKDVGQALKVAQKVVLSISLSVVCHIFFVSHYCHYKITMMKHITSCQKLFIRSFIEGFLISKWSLTLANK